MSKYYVAVHEDLVSPRLRYVCQSVAGYLAAVFDLPDPEIVFLESLPGAPHPGDAHICEQDLDVNVRAAIVEHTPNTIWIATADEGAAVRAVAHEIGHIAELLARVVDRRDIEEFPQLLANAVGTTYAAGVGWIDRLLNSSFYFQAFAEGRTGSGRIGHWQRRDYWHRLAKTRGGYGYLGYRVESPVNGGPPAGTPAVEKKKRSARTLLFLVPGRRREKGGDVAHEA